MSTLVEIESAVVTLPPQQQESLLLWLQSRLRGTPMPAAKSGATSQEWLKRLAVLRDQGRTARTGTPLQTIMDDLRGD